MEQWANWQVTRFQHLLLRSLWPGTSYIISLSHLPNKEVLPNGLIISSFSEHRATLWHICHAREMWQWHKKSETGALESAAPSALLGIRPLTLSAEAGERLGENSNGVFSLGCSPQTLWHPAQGQWGEEHRIFLRRFSRDSFITLIHPPSLLLFIWWVLIINVLCVGHC